MPHLRRDAGLGARSGPATLAGDEALRGTSGASVVQSPRLRTRRRGGCAEGGAQATAAGDSRVPSGPDEPPSHPSSGAQRRRSRGMRSGGDGGHARSRPKSAPRGSRCVLLKRGYALAGATRDGIGRRRTTALVTSKPAEAPPALPRRRSEASPSAIISVAEALQADQAVRQGRSEHYDPRGFAAIQPSLFLSPYVDASSR